MLIFPKFVHKGVFNSLFHYRVVGDQKDLNPHIGALLINMGTVTNEQKLAMLVGGTF